MNIFTKSKGFTLIEIVVVISIMAILSVITYSSFDKSKANSRDQKRVSDISSIQLALEQYFQKVGSYPTKLSDLTLSSPGSLPYISEIPKGPNANETYGYFPITKTTTVDGTTGSNYCVSYQLWTKFEMNNSYLDSKRGFDSVDKLPTGLYECDPAVSHLKVNALADPLVYDVMP